MALFKKCKVGLALGGGGARGYAHIGALKAFEEHGIKFDMIAGTSAGSLVGAVCAAGLPYEKVYEVGKKIEIKDIRSSLLMFVPSKTDGLEKVIKDTLGDIDIEDLQTPFYAVAVDMKTTQELHINKGNLAKAVAGSCAVPGVFNPVEFEDKLLSDGGISNNLPSNILKLYGCDYVVAIDINPSRTYGTDSSKVKDVLACTIRVLMKNTVKKGYLYSDILLKPDTKRFSSSKKEGFEEMIEEGYNEALKHIYEIKALFKKRKLSGRKRKKFYIENNKF